MDSIILFFCTIIFSNNNIVFLESNNFYTISIQEKLNIFFLLLSIGGLPPLLGFFIKLFIIFILIICSVLIIYIYLSIFLSFIITQTIYRKNIFFVKISNFFRLILL